MNYEWYALQFTDLSGRLRQVLLYKDRITPKVLEKGVLKLDGSSVGMAGIEDSDLRLKPFKETLAPVPWASKPTARYICGVEKADGSRLPLDPRWTAERLEEHLGDQGLSVFVGAEIEFFILEEAYTNLQPNYWWFSTSSEEYTSPTGEGYRLDVGIPLKNGYYITEPMDTTIDIRTAIVDTLHEVGIPSTVHHHEVASFGQGEINLGHAEPTKAGDAIVTAKWVARNVAASEGVTVAFLAKLIPDDNGSGMHLHMSLWRDGKNLFYDPDDEYRVSETARYFVGGVVEHLEAVAAFTNSTVNSYRRLVPGYEAPVYAVWGPGNRSAMVRVPKDYGEGEEKKIRLEFRNPDPLANPYLAISAIVMAGLDGIKKKLDPGPAYTKNVYSLGYRERKKLGIKTMPKSLIDALEALESDNEFLKPVFTSELIEQYIDAKMGEAMKLRKYPSVAEIQEYFGL